jgi:uncharacterized membrane protein YphA (DoxX/SURF4 family)
MKQKLPLIARLVLGGAFFIFGLNGFLQFMPTPPNPEKATSFIMALIATGYLFPFMKAVEVLSGAFLLAGRFVPLALVVLAPIILNIFFFHTFLAPAGAPMAFILAGLELFLAWSYRAAYAPLFKSK